MKAQVSDALPYNQVMKYGCISAVVSMAIGLLSVALIADSRLPQANADRAIRTWTPIIVIGVGIPAFVLGNALEKRWRK